MRALVGDSDFAIFTSPSWRTRTSVRSLSSIEASGSILTCGGVIGTIIQILVAKKTTPTFLAVTFPGFITGSMLAPWVSDAISAKSTFPTITTPSGEKQNYKYLVSLQFFKILLDRICLFNAF